MKLLFPLVSLVLLVMLTPAARAEGPDEQYVRIYNLIQQADSLSKLDQPGAALAKYLEAQSDLQSFQKLYPDWNAPMGVNVVNFRLKYLASEISAITAKIPTNGPPAAPTAPPAPAPVQPPATTQIEAPANVEPRLSTLQDEVRNLQADKIVLEAKLKEALAAQPASADPREMQKAQDKIQSLLKENDLLKVSLSQAPVNAPPGADAKAFEETKQALAEANRKLTEQSERANALAIEKKVLQDRLDSLKPSIENLSKLDMTQKALDEASRKLTAQNDMAERLTKEKEALLARIQTLTAGVEAADALRAENQLLKKQVADLKSASAGQTEDLSRQLAQAQARMAAMQSDADILRLEKAALENRVRMLASQPVTPKAPPAVSRPEDMRRIRALEQERDDLLSKLNAANKDLASRKSAPAPAVANVRDLQQQITALHARLGVFEARAVPYSDEELALFKAPEARPPRVESTGAKMPVRQQLPAASSTLIVEAERLFKARQYDRAEEKYLEILRQDAGNVYTLANLAAIQIEMKRFDDAEKNLNQALATAPGDPYALSILGYLRFKQERYDQALDALSRAAELNPQSAEIQNYLGVTLSHKGMRLQAETALRKAIQLEPGYGSAHNNLAVIYATQQPPSLAMARWHYQQALAAGETRNPELEKMLDRLDASAAKP